MASTIALPQNPPISISNKFLRLIPGVALLAVIGFAGKLLEKNINLYAKSHHWTIPNIEYVLWAILIGLAISNIFGLAEIFKPGVATYEFWLKAS
jgi:cellobiose-specific phosphotransferase system component IIC